MGRMLTLMGAGAIMSQVCTVGHLMTHRSLEDGMQFRLIYQGKISKHASPAEKHAIRKQFHPQLSRLWKTHPSLGWMRKNLGLPTITMAKETQPDLDEGVLIPVSYMRMNFDSFADLHRIGDFRFFPLVSDLFATTCSLDILYLRHTTAGPLFNQQTGDIDNRIKVLFDALRMPKPGEEMVGVAPSEGENPF